MHSHGCRRWFNSSATPSPTRSSRSTRWPAPRSPPKPPRRRQLRQRRREAGKPVHERAAFRTPPAAGSTARRPVRFTLQRQGAPGLSPATRSPRRCSPTACIWLARSFKYHRPRGILSAGAEEPNALVQLERGAGPSRTCAPPSSSSTRAWTPAAQNCWPTLELRRRCGQRPAVARSSPPASTTRPSCGRELLDEVYEPLIRRAAGLGRAPAEPDPDRYDKHAHPLRRAGRRRRPRRV